MGRKFWDYYLLFTTLPPRKDHIFAKEARTDAEHELTFSSERPTVTDTQASPLNEKSLHTLRASPLLSSSRRRPLSSPLRRMREYGPTVLLRVRPYNIPSLEIGF